MEKIRAKLNRTIVLSANELNEFRKNFLSLSNKVSVKNLTNKIIVQDFFDAVNFLPEKFVDLLIIDPPYNLTKKYNDRTFKEMDEEKYYEWFDKIINSLYKILKHTASVYVCCDWKSSQSIYQVLKKYFIIRNRITWEREKGRGSKNNWKNNSEDIWFCTFGNEYTFNVDAVKLKKKIIAPYKNENGEPKDWYKSESGSYRLTFPSNIWTDITVPFWSMSENTDHPTQKPEKLIAKLILSSSNENDFVFDPFLGSGTTAVVAKKLNRKFCGIEIDEKFACLAEKRLKQAETNKAIQGYADKVFWERNSLIN